jgi:hypothetical protein
MEGIPGNYDGITLFNVIIDYHKKNEAKGGNRRPHGKVRAKDGLAYECTRSYVQSYGAPTPPPLPLLPPDEVRSGILRREPLETHPEGKILASGGLPDGESIHGLHHHNAASRRLHHNHHQCHHHHHHLILFHL